MIESPIYKELLLDAVRWWINPAHREKLEEYFRKKPKGLTEGWSEEGTGDFVLEALARHPQEVAALVKELGDDE